MKIMTIALLLSACAESPATLAPDAPHEAPVLCPSRVPALVAPPAGFGILFGRAARGVQVYSCEGSPDAGFQWAYVGPQATLHDLGDGRLREVHSTFPSFVSVEDGSWVSTVVRQQVVVDEGSLPWALLEVTGFDRGVYGDGELAFVSWVQRLSTRGDLPPANADCNSGTVGDVREVGYEALYVFYGDEGVGGCR